jgi:tRNA nucleotidyltransferase (CCA-adding enzyme)
VLGICRRLREAGFAAWVVGGAVRDLILGRPVREWDLATAAPPDRVRGLFPRVVPTGIAHGTVTVLGDALAVEVTTFRGDGNYVDGRRPDTVTFLPDVELDLARRDFTVNAMAADPIAGTLVDPFGGIADIRARVLRAVGDPDRRFAEDGLRVMRAARFAAVLAFDLDPATRDAMGRHREVFGKVSRERIRDEMVKLLLAPCPSRGLRILIEADLASVFLPELPATAGMAQNRYHAFDVLEHTLRAVDAAPPRPAVRLAALFHDLGKGETRAWSEEKGAWTFLDHERASARIAGERLAELRFPSAEIERIVSLVSHHGPVYSAEWTDAAVRRWLRRIGPDHREDQLDLMDADVAAKGEVPDAEEARAGAAALRERSARILAQRPALDESALALDGRRIMEITGLGPGPAIGEVKRALLELVTDDPARNTVEALERAVRERAGGGDPPA